MKLSLKIFLLICALVMTLAEPAQAKIVVDKLPLLTYAETPVPVYDAPNGKQKGTIAAGSSLVLVKKIRPDGWAYGSYKVAGKKKRPYRWFRMEELQGYADFENYNDHATYDLDAYRTRTSLNLVGKVASNEELTVVAKRGDKLKVIFRADGNFYRMGWVDKTSLSKTSTTSTDETISTDGTGDLTTSGGGDELLQTTETPTEEFDGAEFDEGDFSEEFEGDFSEEVAGDSEMIEPLDEEESGDEDELPPDLRDAEEVPDDKPLDEELLPGDEKVPDVPPDDETFPDGESFIESSASSHLGDINDDGSIDAIDIALLQKYLRNKSTPINLDNADLNGDEYISMLDVNVLLNLVKAAGKGTGDVDGDGKIDSRDVQTLTAYLARQTVTLNPANADLNGDGAIDELDLKILEEVIATRK